MGLVYLLDTNFVSELHKESPLAIVKTKIATMADVCCISSVTWHEMKYGLESMPEGKRKKELYNFLYDLILKRFPILDYDQSAASLHAKFQAELKAAGTPKPYADTQIASIALANGLILVTHNVKDFEGIPLLAVEDWAV